MILECQPIISKYQRWYNQIIERARTRKLDSYKERHHIVPRSFGGSDDPSNLVDLTYREHFLVHWLLTKFCSGHERRSMVFALNCMSWEISENRLVASWYYDVINRAFERQSIQGQKERREQRRATARPLRIKWRAKIQTEAAQAEKEAPTLNPARSSDRVKLNEMTALWLKGTRKKINLLDYQKTFKPI